jgi:hypothetical protein
MAGILDMLLGGLSGGALSSNTNQLPPPSADPSASSLAPPAQTTVSDLDVVAPKRTPISGAGYNNLAELNAIHHIQDQYLQADQGHQNGSGTGLVNMIPAHLPGRQVLRNLLGTLGDAFLVQSGHQPAYAQQKYNQQISDASAGFENDPGGAASRIAATGAPGSFEDANKLFDINEQRKLREATIENTQAYREGVLSDRENYHNAQIDSLQQKNDDRIRTLNGGILAAAAKTGDPKMYASARAAALARIGPNSHIDPNEYPEDLKDFNAGYGLTANQYGRNQVSEDSIAERAHAAGQSSFDRQAAIAQRAAIAAQVSQDRHRGQDLRNNRLVIPGLTPQGSGTNNNTQLNPIHVYPSGRKAQWNGRQWVPLK